MRSLPLALAPCLLGLALVGCAPRVGNFKADHFAHEYHTYKISYAGSGADRIMGPNWMPLNWTAKDGKSRWAHKSGTEFAVSRTFDFDGDGVQDYFRLEAIRDFDFKHKNHDARVWLQVVPMAANDQENDLGALAQRYVETELPKDIGSGSVTGEGDICEVSGKSAMQFNFEAGGRRGHLVVVDPGQPEKVGPKNYDTRIFYYVVYVAEADAAEAGVEDFSALLDRLAIGGSKKKSIPGASATTCQPRATNTLETEAPRMEETPEPEPEPTEEPSEDEPEDDTAEEEPSDADEEE